jgi:hypothetical protein
MYRTCGAVFCSACSPVARDDGITMGTCLCTGCQATLAKRVGLANDDDGSASPTEQQSPISRLATTSLEAEQDLTHTYEWVEAPEEDAKEQKKKTKEIKKQAKEKRKNNCKGGRRGKKATTLEDEEVDDSSATSGANVAAALLVSVLETMERKKKGRELRWIELKALRQGVAVTGRRTSVAGWDESFASRVAKLTGDRPQLTINIISSVRTTVVPPHAFTWAARQRRSGDLPHAVHVCGCNRRARRGERSAITTRCSVAA